MMSKTLWIKTKNIPNVENKLSWSLPTDFIQCYNSAGLVQTKTQDKCESDTFKHWSALLQCFHGMEIEQSTENKTRETQKIEDEDLKHVKPRKLRMKTKATQRLGIKTNGSHCGAVVA